MCFFSFSEGHYFYQHDFNFTNISAIILEKHKCTNQLRPPSCIPSSFSVPHSLPVFTVLSKNKSTTSNRIWHYRYNPPGKIVTKHTSVTSTKCRDTLNIWCVSSWETVIQVCLFPYVLMQNPSVDKHSRLFQHKHYTTFVSFISCSSSLSCFPQIIAGPLFLFLFHSCHHWKHHRLYTTVVGLMLYCFLYRWKWGFEG